MIRPKNYIVRVQKNQVDKKFDLTGQALLGCRVSHFGSFSLYQKEKKNKK